jgi:hypothetical protein
MHSKPLINLEDENFSKSFVHSKSSLILHAQIIENYIKVAYASHRDWTTRYNSLPDGDRKEGQGNRRQVYFSPLKPGLPEKVYAEDIPTVVMHHPSIVVGMIEIVPSLQYVADIWKIIEKTLQSSEALVLSSTKTFNPIAAECSILKLLNVTFLH